MTLRSAVYGLLLAGLAAAPASAQEDAEAPLAPVRVLAGLHLVGAAPTGDFADYIDGGFGIGGDVVFPVRTNGWFAIRAGVDWVIYGDETRRIPFPGTGGLIDLELNTTNSILLVGLGPQLMAPSGPVRPYANVNGGFAYFSTTSSLRGDDDQEPFATDRNHDDFTLAWSAGGGLLIPLSHGRTPISLDLGAHYQGNGEAEYVTEEGIEQGTGDQYLITPTRSDANFVTIRLGVTIGIRGKQPR